MSRTEANYWWRATRADLKAMEICYKKKLYGISAYHCQQALEKAVKSAIIYHRIPVDTKALGHNVLHKMFDKMIPEMSIPEEQKEYNQKVLKLLKSVGQNVQFETNQDTMGDNVTTKDFFWGQSLGINFPNKNLEEFLEETDPSMVDAVTKFPPPLLVLTAKVGQSMTSDDFDGLIDYALNNLKLKIKISKPELRLWYWALINIITILKITPHEEYGRYPGIVRGKQREEWYHRNCKNLGKLESDVRRAIVIGPL